MIKAMVGRSVALQRVERTVDTGPARLKVRDLSLAGTFADISFDVAEGEIVAVAGLVGSGRSEIAQAIFGLSPQVTGTIEVDGRPAKPDSPAAMARRGVVYLPEDRDAEGIIASMSITANVALPSIRELAVAGFMAPRRSGPGPGTA